MLALRQLLHLVRGGAFRRLFAVRLVSQFGDGAFQVAWASYALFSPERQATPGQVSLALIVLLLPFTVVGPFAGVFLDRWSRRQVLLVVNLVRGVLAGLAVAVVAIDAPTAILFALVLASLALNRFLLSALSAALPHTVDREEFVTANALTPTAGTVSIVVGIACSFALRARFDSSDAAPLALAGVAFIAAGALSLRMPRPSLGPDHQGPDHQGPESIRDGVGGVLRGLVEGVRHLNERRGARNALAAFGVFRYGYGLVTVMVILTQRNHLYPGDPDAAFADLSYVAVATGVGLVIAAATTPSAILRFGVAPWISTMLLFAAASEVAAGFWSQAWALIVLGGLLGTSAQGIKIAVDTAVQTHVEDDYRGRVFSVYDVVFNGAFILAGLTSALVLPDDGVSPAASGAVAAIFLFAFAGYRLRQETTRTR
jgi:MFS family permease